MLKRILYSLIIFGLIFIFTYALPFFINDHILVNPDIVWSYMLSLLIIPVCLGIIMILYLFLIYYPFLNWIYWLRTGNSYQIKDKSNNLDLLKSGWFEIETSIAFGKIKSEKTNGELSHIEDK